MSTFGERVMVFNRALQLKAKLPAGVAVMNPFREPGPALHFSASFYEKYYGDDCRRHIILGINPGRFGAALSGIPFTDFKRLEQYCGISAEGHRAHEPSSEFVYQMITAMGPVEDFYARFYINSVCPLGFVHLRNGGKGVNYNYYDDPALFAAVKPFIVRNIRQQIEIGCYTDTCFCLGIRNGEYLQRLNGQHHFFKRIVVLPHPRFIMQYRRKAISDAIAQYAAALSDANA